MNKVSYIKSFYTLKKEIKTRDRWRKKEGMKKNERELKR